MYIESDGSRKSLGDVDVLYHEGIYHLFHLVLPNHDYIAHAISRDGLYWIRVENALFIGHPGAWDDSMLWTMHVSADPHRPGHWRMFYTGISRHDRGLKQRIGMARSQDLYNWTKADVSWVHNGKLPRKPLDEPTCIAAMVDATSCFPIEPSDKYYESDITKDRKWVSWRDPYYVRDQGKGWLLCSGRVNDGPLVRRGCVAAIEETGVDQFECREPLHHPGLYDDIEVPNLLRIADEYYLIGSIREDAKIRYWHTKKIGDPWQSYSDNVLLGQGNYAGRICEDDAGLLIWSFFSRNDFQRTSSNILPPPKRLVRNPAGFLRVQTYEKIIQRVTATVDAKSLCPLGSEIAPANCEIIGTCTRLTGCSGFQAFVFQENESDFRLSAQATLSGAGKCGLVLRIDRQSRDGYYISLDLLKGVAQLRGWGTDNTATGEHMMKFETLQSGYWYTETPGVAHLQLIAWGSYIELSIDQRVVLSVANHLYDSGAVGFYVESAEVELRHLQLDRLEPPAQSDEHLAVG